jgi:superfamily II DNA or RNA helicase
VRRARWASKLLAVTPQLIGVLSKPARTNWAIPLRGTVLAQQGTALSRKTKVFDWTRVPDGVIHALLTARAFDVGADVPSPGDLQRLSRLALSGTAAKNLGRPPTKRAFRGNEVVDYLRKVWLPSQPPSVVEAVVVKVSVGRKRQPPATTRLRLDYLAGLNRTESLALALRSAFVAQYKIERVARRQAVAIGGGSAAQVILLSGRDEPGMSLYEHQTRAHLALTAWEAGDSVGGMVVLPTGAGKTATMVTWLLGWLAAGADRRVLWLAHQRELVDQAAKTFSACAQAQPRQFERRLRVIHGAGSTVSTLAEVDLTVAVATMQSVRLNSDPKRAQALRRFADGPTIVVVDEAHRSGSETYHELLQLLHGCPSVRMIGLTATPVPSGAIARRRLASRFPDQLVSVGADELVLQGILARPIFHKVDTHVSVELSAADVRRALTLDVPDAVLRRLATPVRNRIIVDTWIRNRSMWGKTLVFATSIDHADALVALLKCHQIDARAVHSRLEHPPSEALDWFRAAAGDVVLVSVGMLTEGVDLPDAQTAFLARPTSSAVLMRQMVGRVLRGPRANGTVVAHLVTLHDDWVNFSGVLEPVDLKSLPEAFEDEKGEPGPPRFSFVDEDQRVVPRSVAEQVEGLYNDHAPIASQGAFLSRADLIGYYETGEMRVPVFDHQRGSFAALIRDVTNGESLTGRPAASYFADDPLPHPRARHLMEIVREIRETGCPPVLSECRIVITPDATAAGILAAGVLTQDQRQELIAAGWVAGGALSYPSVDHWYEAVDSKVRELVRRQRKAGTVCDPEYVHHPIRARRANRDIQNLFEETLERGRALLDSDDTRMRLSRLPIVRWSARPLATSYAHWSIRRAGPTVTVNTALQVSKRHVSDELLRYLLWHELLHHVLPGHGHDAEFRMLESRWHGALDLDRELDTLHERIGERSVAPVHR